MQINCHLSTMVLSPVYLSQQLHKYFSLRVCARLRETLLEQGQVDGKLLLDRLNFGHNAPFGLRREYTALSVTDECRERAVIRPVCRSATRANGQNCSFIKI